MIDEGSKFNKRKVAEQERRQMRQKRTEKYHRQLAQEHSKKRKIDAKIKATQDEDEDNALAKDPEFDSEESDEKGGVAKVIAPRSWYLDINQVKVGDFVMLEVMYKVKGGRRKGVTAAKVSSFF